MKKQEHVEFTDLADLLNRLEENSGKYKTRMLGDDTVLVGDVYIRRYYNIDPENADAQYDVIAGNNEYKILPNNKIWTRGATEVDKDFVLLDYSANEAESMWYQIATVHQGAINKNFTKFYGRQTKRDLILILAVSLVSSITANITRNILDKRQDKVHAAKEIPADTTKTQINPVDTIMYNAVQHTK